MIGIDTNVFVRFFLRDDPTEFEQSRAFLSDVIGPNRPGVVTHVVLAELVWVLRQEGRLSKDLVVEALTSIIESSRFDVQERPVARSALADYAVGSADFSDYLIGRMNERMGADTTATLDRRAASAAYFSLLGSVGR